MQAWPDTLNAYPYALNNPANLTDPSGEFVLAPVIIGGAIGGVIGGVGYVISNPGQSLGDYLKSGEFLEGSGRRRGRRAGSWFDAAGWGGTGLGNRLWDRRRRDSRRSRAASTNG